jgi:hypothetical protein
MPVLPSMACPTYPVPTACLSTPPPPVFLSPAVLYSLSCPGCLLPCPFCHVLGVPSSLFVQSDLSRPTFQANLSTCPSFPVLTIPPRLSCARCPTTVVLSQPFFFCHVLAILFLSCPGYHDPADLTCQPVRTDLSKLSHPGCPVHGCPIKDALHQLSCPIKNKKV